MNQPENAEDLLLTTASLYSQFARWKNKIVLSEKLPYDIVLNNSINAMRCLIASLFFTTNTIQSLSIRPSSWGEKTAHELFLARTIEKAYNIMINEWNCALSQSLQETILKILEEHNWKLELKDLLNLSDETFQL
jgi:hypothetical protein